MQYIYFDHNATTPVAPEVLRDLTETLVEVCGNASSIHHFGQAAKQRLEASRREIAARIGSDPREIVFTSGGTESDNLAIFGIARKDLAKGSAPGSGLRQRNHVITSVIEHPAVLNACAQLEREGAEVTYLPVGAEGIVRLDDVKRALRSTTGLITVMHANNETGALQPVREIGVLARASGAVFHSDGVQMAGRVQVNVREIGVDLYSISGHKFGAPKGIGALYVRKGTALDPMLFGGHHERDRRAGTENVPGASALGRAAGLAVNWAEIGVLRDRLERGILTRVRGAQVNGPSSNDQRIPNTTNIRFDGIEGEAIVIALDLRGYAVSSGSACSSGAVEPSHVLLAMGLSPEEARSSVRFSLGPENTEKEVDGLIEAVEASVAHLRRISPIGEKPTEKPEAKPVAGKRA
ncbi:MAG: cysteine desulfurase family protein [Bryobacteraceae bacterium]|jgi:cysteine desulfurase